MDQGKMEIGIVGIGKMGGNMAKRLIKSGARVVVFDRSAEAVDAAVSGGAEAADSLEDLVAKLDAPRAVWVMLPAGDPTEQTVDQLARSMEAGDIIIDGGNSNYRDSVARAQRLKERGIHGIDVGTSGGVWGLSEGYSMMVGGDEEAVERLRPIFEALAPAADRGWGRVGPPGAGHFVKMIHNGIEYGMMQAYAEGFAIMKAKEQFGLDLHQISRIWQHGSVVRSWLLDLTADVLEENADLIDIAAYVQDSGEGRWTVQEAIDLDVPAPIITMSLLQRLRSRVSGSYADKLLAAMRRAFGGHAIREE